MKLCTKPYKKRSKAIKSDNFYYRKVERSKTKWGAIGKGQYCDCNIGKLKKNISHSGYTNNLFVDIIYSIL